MFQSISSAVINKNSAGGVKKVEVISVTSGKGGVGKSTLSANMAILLQKMNHKVLLIDADIHLGNLDLILGIRVRHSIADVLQKGMALQDVIVKGPGNIDILPASSATVDLITTEDILLKKLSQAFAKFQHDYDVILIDTGAGIAQTVISFLMGSDKIALVITPDPASIADAYAVIKVIRSVNMAVPIFLIPNMVSSAEEAEILYRKMNLMVNKFLNSQIILGGSVLKDEMVSWSVKKQNPFVVDHPHSTPANSLRLLNRKILSANGDAKGIYSNIFDRLISNKKIQFEWNL